MQNSFTKKEQFLIALFHELVNHVKYDNDFIFKLLKEVTLSKKTVIAIDGARLELSATDDNKYTLHVHPVNPSTPSSFMTKGDCLREIINGAITLDQAISTNKIVLKGTLENLLGIYRLAIGLLVEGPSSPYLRGIWDAFDQHWQNNVPNDILIDLELQQVTDYFSNLNVNSEINNVEISY